MSWYRNNSYLKIFKILFSLEELFAYPITKCCVLKLKGFFIPLVVLSFEKILGIEPKT